MVAGRQNLLFGKCALDLVAREQHLRALYGCGHGAPWGFDPASYQCHESRVAGIRRHPVEGSGASNSTVSRRLEAAARQGIWGRDRGREDLRGWPEHERPSEALVGYVRKSDTDVQEAP